MPITGEEVNRGAAHRTRLARSRNLAHRRVRDEACQLVLTTVEQVGRGPTTSHPFVVRRQRTRHLDLSHEAAVEGGNMESTGSMIDNATARQRERKTRWWNLITALQ